MFEQFSIPLIKNSTYIAMIALSIFVIVLILMVVYKIYKALYKMWADIILRMSFSTFMRGFGISVMATISCIALAIFGGFALSVFLLVFN